MLADSVVHAERPLKQESCWRLASSSSSTREAEPHGHLQFVLPVSTRSSPPACLHRPSRLPGSFHRVAPVTLPVLSSSPGRGSPFFGKVQVQSGYRYGHMSPFPPTELSCSHPPQLLGPYDGRWRAGELSLCLDHVLSEGKLAQSHVPVPRTPAPPGE